MRELEESRKTTTLQATVRHLELASVDGALDLLDVLMAFRLLARADQVGKDKKLKALPKQKRAAGRVAKVGFLLETAPATESGELSSTSARLRPAPRWPGRFASCRT
ncbi:MULTISPECIES: hypothetical protein [unclassified Streptomyces]|uniref:hypothetical protein n=1 Tax=unclassified Streptomyces TaxID=2593676 RepID=UPI002DDA2E63|nr:hypothetical protein [Streptomyces sp. NBC_01237]WRZ76426.1 hypothetical protein OG251_35070 [Streptomyces sp. NBC_01237]